MKTLVPLLALCLLLPASAARKPDVLFIAIDDLNHWVGYTGRNKQSATPNIDRLSKMGTSFSNAHCVAPACNPSRAALMTGMRPSTTACYTNGDFWTRFIPEGRGLSQAFRKAGYVDDFIHSTSHHLGLETHDVGDVHRPLEEGCVITVEPGIYLPDEAIGVRIEEDVLVTADGPRVLTEAIPSDPEEIERRMA